MVFVRDLTERRAAEAEKSALEHRLVRAEKLEAIGSMAGGIAHDFNNLLTPVVLLIDAAMADLPIGSTAQEDLEEALRAARQGKRLVDDLFRFSRGNELERATVSLGEVVESTARLLRVAVRNGVTIEPVLEAEGRVSADVGQLSQVVMNLGKNAAQAMAADGGTVTIRVDEVEAVAPDADGTARLIGCACLTVSDTGHGMTPETLEHLFEPLYTTKSQEAGTGLGLAVVNRIVQEHGGWIDVGSEPGRGTTFRVYLPLVESSVKVAEAVGA